MIRTCAHDACHRTFHPKRSDAEYCSDTCRAIASRKRRMGERNREYRDQLNERVATMTAPLKRIAVPLRQPVEPPAPPPAPQAPPPEPAPVVRMRGGGSASPDWRDDFEMRLIGIHDFAKSTSDQVESLEARVQELEGLVEILSNGIGELQESLAEALRALV